MTATAATVATRYPDEVKALAFEVWAFECDRNLRRTAARMRELLPVEGAAPSHQALSHWARQAGWEVMADQAIAEVAPNLRGRQLARLFTMGNRALDTMAAILEGECDDTPAASLQARVSVSLKVLELLGLGTAAGRGAPLTLTVAAASPVDLDQHTPQELARMQREALLERNRPTR